MAIEIGSPSALPESAPGARSCPARPPKRRALPAAAGSVLGWTSKLLHWGAMADAHAPPRISISFEYQAAAAPLYDGVHYPLGYLPSATERRTDLHPNGIRLELTLTTSKQEEL